MRSTVVEAMLFAEDVHHPETGAVGVDDDASMVTINQFAVTHSACAFGVVGLAEVKFFR